MTRALCENQPVFAEVVAVPPGSNGATRPRARFKLTEDVPLRIGRSSRCRLQVDAPVGQDLLLGLVEGHARLWSEPGIPIPSSLNGVTVDREARLDVFDGDHLFLTGGLVLAVRDAPAVEARHPGLEAALAQDPADLASLQVYQDFLAERSDPLARWLTNPRRQVEAERFRVLGPLGESARTQAVEVTFHPTGLAASLTLGRPGIVGAPGLFWHLERLAQVPVLRALTAVELHYVVGHPARSILAPNGVEAWPKEPPLLLVVEQALEHLGRAPCAQTLERLSFGNAVPSVSLPEQVADRVARRFPRWNGGSLLGVHQGR